MVKVSEKPEASMRPGTGPASSLTSDGSFVVLERSPPQEPGGNHPNGASQPNSNPFQSNISTNQPRENQSSSLIQGSLPSDLSPDEIQRKLQEVLQENAELKETLHQNNLAMKQQFNTLVMWQDEVFKVHQSHKEKFQETKELILKLRAENAELKNYLETKAGNDSDKQLKTENAKLKGQVAELQQKLSGPMPRRDLSAGPTKKEEELTELVRQLNEKLETAERSRRQLTIDVERLTALKTRTEKDLALVKNELEEEKEKILLLEGKNGELLQTMNQYEQEMREFVVVEKQDRGEASFDQEFRLLKQQFDRQQTEMVDLKNRLAKEEEVKEKLLTELQQQKAMFQEFQQKHQQEMEKHRNQEKPKTGALNKKDFADYVESFEENLKLCNNSLAKQTERYGCVDAWLQNTISNIDHWRPGYSADAQSISSLRAELQEVRRLLAQEQAYSKEKKVHVIENQAQFHQLFKDFQSLLRQWEAYKRDQTQQGNSYQDAQNKSFTEKLDRLTAEVLCKEEEIKICESEMKEMKEKVRKLELENEAIPILKAQVEVYQADFNAEREARENLAGDKEKITEDLRHLQRRNQQLLDDLETYQQNHFDQMQNKAPPSNTGSWSTIATPGRAAANAKNLRQQPSPVREPSPAKVSQTEGRQIYSCPVCNKEFPQLRPLEQHVEMCLDFIP